MEGNEYNKDMEVKIESKKTKTNGNLEEIKDFIELNENKHTKYPNLWETMKVVLTGMLIALNSYMEKLARFQTSNLTAHPKIGITTKRNKWQEITKLRPEIKPETNKLNSTKNQ